MPADRCVRLEDGKSGEAAGPNPEEALEKADSEPFVAPRGDHRQLLRKRQDLQMEEGATTRHASQGIRRQLLWPVSDNYSGRCMEVVVVSV